MPCSILRAKTCCIVKSVPSLTIGLCVRNLCTLLPRHFVTTKLSIKSAETQFEISRVEVQIKESRITTFLGTTLFPMSVTLL